MDEEKNNEIENTSEENHEEVYETIDTEEEKTETPAETAETTETTAANETAEAAQSEEHTSESIKEETKEEEVKTAPVREEKPDYRYYVPPREQKVSDGAIWRTILLVLLCALIGLGTGYGGSALYSATHKEETKSTESGIVYQNVTNTNASYLASDDSDSRVAIVEKVQNSVVQITTEKLMTSYFYGNYVASGAGSGVIITSNGYIVTNYHVISGASKITVTTNPNGDTYEATLIGVDEQKDLALVKINATDLQAAVLGDSDGLKAGQSIIVIGNPLGTLGGSVTSGIVSATSRDITVEGVKMNLLQISAAVNPGNSGGALFDYNGNLVGIVNAKYIDEDVEGIAFAIPINTAKPIINELFDKGYISKVQLGVQMIDITTRTQMYSYEVSRAGVYISKILEDSDAEKGGLQVKDLILSIDDVDISTTEDAAAAIKAHKVGDVIKVKVMRDEEILTFEIELTEQGDKVTN